MTTKEELLHYAWRTQRIDARQMKTTTGDTVYILNFGQYNLNAGPDFLNAKILIGRTTWVGHVEMHLKSSDWLKHRHSEDAAYNTVILHVVLEEDVVIYTGRGVRLPCLDLTNYLPPKLNTIYEQLYQNEDWIPCAKLFPTVPEMTKLFCIDRILVERLEQKTAAIKTIWDKCNQNWEETFYRCVAQNFGLKVNAEPFAWLSESLSLRVLQKHKDNLFQLEALLFGQAGLLEDDFEEDYPQQLQKEYQFLRKKYSLQPIRGVAWKFLRMRPANFPTVRIAQFARLIFQSTHLLRKVIDAPTPKEIRALFQVELEGYWLTHYRFGKSSKERKKSLGKQMVDLILINTIVPFLFFYCEQLATAMEQQHKAVDLLQSIDAEKNSIMEGWLELGMDIPSAYESQALIHLKRYYCDAKRCLECQIGSDLLGQSAKPHKII